MEQQIYYWIGHYGYAAIFVLLVFGIVGLPVPDETLLTFTGYLIFKGKLHLAAAFFSALLGSACGITVSYILGRTFGLALIHRYGKYIHLTEDKIRQVHNWFERVGRWGLTFGYFIPGVRHFTAYAAGISDLEAPVFGIFAYSGALAWCSTFICLGYLLGERWQAVARQIEHHGWLALAAFTLLALAYLAWQWRRARSR